VLVRQQQQQHTHTDKQQKTKQIKVSNLMTNFLLQFLEASEIAVPQVAVVLVREAAHLAVDAAGGDEDVAVVRVRRPLTLTIHLLVRHGRIEPDSKARS
jgi:hypothetical protein